MVQPQNPFRCRDATARGLETRWLMPAKRLFCHLNPERSRVAPVPLPTPCCRPTGSVDSWARGAAVDPVAAIKWHTIAKAGGLGDTFLDEFASKQSAETRAAGEAAAKPWLHVQSRS